MGGGRQLRRRAALGAVVNPVLLRRAKHRAPLPAHALLKQGVDMMCHNSSGRLALIRESTRIYQ